MHPRQYKSFFFTVKLKLKNYGRVWLQSVRENWPYYLVVLAIMLLCRYFWGQAPKDLGKVLKEIEAAHAAGDLASAEDYFKASLPRLAKVHFFVCWALLIAGPWLSGKPAVQVAEVPKPSSRWLWVVTGLMIAVSAWLNAPRLSHSFWNDEEWTARRLVVGEFQEGGKLKKPSWNRTFFFYIDPNNHPMFSVLARLSYSLVSVPQEKVEFAFREWPVRLPAYLFGLGGLAALAWLATVIGLPRAGIIAVVWMALHPWHVRYGGDARGYALLLALLPLSTALVWRALEKGSLNGWLAFGLSEFLVLWTYPGALYFVVVLNAVACGMMALRPVPVARWLQWRRYAAGSLIGALLTSLMLAPCVQPMLIFLKGERLRGDLSGSWVLETVSGLLTGIPWARWADHELALSWMRTWAAAPWLVVLTFTAVAGALAAGVAALIGAGSRQRWLFVLLGAIGPFMYLMARLQGNFLYPWYMVLSLPGFAILVGVGVDVLAGRVLGDKHRWVLPVVFLALFGGVTWAQNQVLRQHPVEPMRESVAAMRTERNALTAGLPGKVLTGSACYPARLYDPAAVPLKSVADLRALMARADEQKLPLFIDFADRNFLKLRDPEMMAVLDDVTKFVALPVFPGIHNQAERWVFRYLGQAGH